MRHVVLSLRSRDPAGILLPIFIRRFSVLKTPFSHSKLFPVVEKPTPVKESVKPPKTKGSTPSGTDNPQSLADISQVVKQIPIPTTTSLPGGWEERKDDKGRVFFVDHKSKKTVWEDPRTGQRHPDTIAYYENQRKRSQSNGQDSTQSPQPVQNTPSPLPVQNIPSLPVQNMPAETAPTNFPLPDLSLPDLPLPLPPIDLPLPDLPPMANLPLPPSNLPMPVLPPMKNTLIQKQTNGHPVKNSQKGPPVKVANKASSVPIQGGSPQVMPPNKRSENGISKKQEKLFGHSDLDLEIKPLGPPVGRLKKSTSKPRAKPADADHIINKLSSGGGGPDKNFWLDFENTVLNEIRQTVDEVDPIEWLLKMADSETGFGMSSQQRNTSQVTPEDDLMKTLAEIDRATEGL